MRHTFATEAAKAGATSVQLSRMTGDLISTLDKFYVEANLNSKQIEGFENLLKPIDINDKKLLSSQEPERIELHELIDQLDIEKVKKVLSVIRNL